MLGLIGIVFFVEDEGVGLVVLYVDESYIGGYRDSTNTCGGCSV
jgi:hypothetical protein